MWVTSQLNIISQFSLILPPFLWVDSSELLSFSKQHISKILENRGLLKCTSSISDNTKLRKTVTLPWFPETFSNVLCSIHSPQGGICVQLYHDPLAASFYDDYMQVLFCFVLSCFYVFFSPSMCTFYKLILRRLCFLMLSVGNELHFKTRRYILR